MLVNTGFALKETQDKESLSIDKETENIVEVMFNSFGNLFHLQYKRFQNKHDGTVVKEKLFLKCLPRTRLLSLFIILVLANSFLLSIFLLF